VGAICSYNGRANKWLSKYEYIGRYRIFDKKTQKIKRVNILISALQKVFLVMRENTIANLVQQWYSCNKKKSIIPSIVTE
jgi:hypothetical protein